MTPTPVPSSQIVQAVQATQNIIDSAVQQGIVGVLLLIAISAVFISLGFAIRAYSNRNQKPESDIPNNAIQALAENTRYNNEREERLEAERRQERSEYRTQIEKRDIKFIEAITHLGDGYNRVGDTLAGVLKLLEADKSDNTMRDTTFNAMKDDIGQMVNVGSVPLRRLIENVDGYGQDLIRKVDAIALSVDEIKNKILPCVDAMDLREQDRRKLDGIQEEVNELKASMQDRIEEKRKSDTSELVAITVNNNNVLPDDNPPLIAGAA